MKTAPKKTAKSFPSGPGFDRPVQITGKDRRVSMLLPTVEAREYEQGAGDWHSTPQAWALEAMKPNAH